MPRSRVEQGAEGEERSIRDSRSALSGRFSRVSSGALDEVPTSTPTTNCGLLALLFRLATPVLFRQVSLQATAIIAGALVGHTAGGDALAAVGLGSVFVNVSGYSMIQGLGGFMDTFCSQAWGAQDFRAMGRAARQGIVVMYVWSAIAAVMWFFTEPVAKLVGQNDEVSRMVGEYTRIRAGALVILGPSTAVVRMQYAAGNTVHQAWALAVGAAAGIGLMCYLILGEPDMGARGAACGLLAQDVVSSLVGIAAGLCDPNVMTAWRATTWAASLWGKAANWGRTIRVSLGSAAILVGEWWALEVVIVLAKDELATQTVVINLVNFLWFIERSWAIPMTALAGNALGSGDAEEAVRVCAFGTKVYIVYALIQNGAVILLGRPLLDVLGGDSEVTQEGVKVLWLAMIYNLLDGFQLMETAAIRACGTQAKAACPVMAAYWCVAVPVAAVLTFCTGLGLKSLWIGMLSGVIVHCLALGRIILTTDWAQVAEETALLRRESSLRGTLRDSTAPGTSRRSSETAKSAVALRDTIHIPALLGSEYPTEYPVTLAPEDPQDVLLPRDDGGEGANGGHRSPTEDQGHPGAGT